VGIIVWRFSQRVVRENMNKNHARSAGKMDKKGTRSIITSLSCGTVCRFLLSHYRLALFPARGARKHE